jgi:formylmethanofuran dehydrogenase subunit B
MDGVPIRTRRVLWSDYLSDEEVLSRMYALMQEAQQP